MIINEDFAELTLDNLALALREIFGAAILTNAKVEPDDVEDEFSCDIVPFDMKAEEAAKDINMIRKSPATVVWHENKSWPDYMSIGAERRKLYSMSIANSGLGKPDKGLGYPWEHGGLNSDILVERVNPDFEWLKHDRYYQYNFWKAEPTGCIVYHKDYARTKDGKYFVHESQTPATGNEVLDELRQFESDILKRIAGIPFAPRPQPGFKCMASLQRDVEKFFKSKDCSSQANWDKWLDDNIERIISELEESKKDQKQLQLSPEERQERGRRATEAALDLILNRPIDPGRDHIVVQG